MMDITELQRRLTAALDRIGTGIEGLELPQPAPEPVAAPEVDPEAPTVAELQAELESEREVTAQLEERVRAIKERQETRVATLERDLAAAQEALAALEAERGRLKDVNATLRENNRGLREANRNGLADAGLINEAMESELEALRAARDSDRAEMDQILGALAPLVADADRAGEAEQDKEATADA